MDEGANGRHIGLHGEVIPFNTDIALYNWQLAGYNASEWEQEKRCFKITRIIFESLPKHNHIELLDAFGGVDS